MEPEMLLRLTVVVLASLVDASVGSMQRKADGSFLNLFSVTDSRTQKGDPLHSAVPESVYARNRQKRRLSMGSQDRECRLKSVLLRVKDLGLGYESEETILFKFCGGTCSKARTNHDLTLSVLLQKSDIPALIEEKIFSDPCCRPSHYEDVAFLDDSHQWHKVEKLSASACGCVG